MKSSSLENMMTWQAGGSAGAYHYSHYLFVYTCRRLIDLSLIAAGAHGGQLGVLPHADLLSDEPDGYGAWEVRVFGLLEVRAGLAGAMF